MQSCAREDAGQSMPTQLQKLFLHLAWADAEVLQALRSAAGSEPRALTYFAHVLAAEHVWLARIRGELARMAVWPVLSLDECAVAAADSADAFSAIVSDANTDALQRSIPYVNSAGRAFTSTLEDILLHVALHGAYHRGQVSIFVRDGGGIPAPTDYIGFARGVPAATTHRDSPPA